MLITKCHLLLITALLIAFAPTAISANVWLTDKQFQNRNVSEFVGIDLERTDCIQHPIL